MMSVPGGLYLDDALRLAVSLAFLLLAVMRFRRYRR